MTDEETEVWNEVVSAEAADWFTPANAPLLAQYARHVVHAKRIAGMIVKQMAEYDHLLRMQERESRVIASLATKMRLGQQSVRADSGNAVRSRAPVTTVPWDI